MAGNEKKHAERAIALEGVLDRLVFASDSSEFIVGRLTVRGRRDPVTIVGLLPKPRPGETLLLQGQWEFDKKFGEQFRFETAEARVPSTIQGIEKYLSSDLIKGIGPEMAKRITAVFGEKTLDIIEKKPEKLRNVPGIGPVRAEKISEAFVEQKSIRDVMLFLQTHGVSTTYAYKIFKRYGNKSARVVSENPYVLATDIRGIGFRSADKIAGSIGIDMRSPLRANAGILHVLDTAQAEGHVYYPLPTLLQKSRELLGIDNHTLEKCVENLAVSGTVVIEGDDRVYLAAMAARENAVARNMRELMIAARFLPGIKIDAAIQWVQQQQGLTLSEAQCEALHAVVEYKVLIVTGGPGTGKTTLLKSLIEILERKKLRVLLCAPTGRAAKRLAEATGREARTVHRLLEYSPSEGGFQRGPSRPLEAEAVVVDETSMVDISLMYYLLGAIHPQTTLILVGDADQLPSVGPGNVLGDLIESGKIHVVRLQTVFRQASESMIVMNAHRINQGLLPAPTGDANALSDFYFIEKDDPDECVRLIKEMVSNRIPGRFGFDPVNDLQILSPMHKGSLGTENLNRELREVLNPYGTKIRGDRFRVGDRVMQTRNNYDKEVFNGDIGRIENYNTEEEEALIEFDGRSVIYHISELDEIALAYAVTIHKAQGSEYPCVIIPMTTQHYVLLRRNLLYTALTRGKSLVVVIGSLKALQMAVENRIVEPRFTHLAAKI
ncbi:SF1B family DNA helicase RecD2 [Desulfomonile tiedjei]|uniref:Helicase, putative, RecD/TraA family n=1 Tax=Desulfomonile tiedjei (strain ATCC 49306 / DSM 6799 / DCB-1) TaxID=706587 RepID=I4C120_DESTA|nr:ATP-dependent RecD-like DNA helicase [Desulfomonile tiedjei]AFM23261.1 helicase, putative, RecD/TraA family [Desulfomonile tiedjei DSM 6799]